MPEGIIATVDDGYATLDFVDKSLKGPALAALIEAGGPGIVETITRQGPRRKYRVPEGNALEAGLIESDAPSVQPRGSLPGGASGSADNTGGTGTTTEHVNSAGADSGFAAALVGSDPNDVVVTVVVTATAGNWKYTYGGWATTPVAFNVNAATLLDAIVALANVEPGEVTVTSPVAKTFVVRHKGRKAISVASDTTTPLTGGTVTVTTPSAEDMADWHTPVDQYISANKYNGQVPNDTVLHSRNQVFTGSAGSFGGSAEAPTSRDLIDYITAAENAARGGVAPVSPFARESAGAFNAAWADHDGALGTDPGATPDDGTGFASDALADQTSALGDDPGAVPTDGGEALGDFSTVQSTRTELPSETPVDPEEASDETTPTETTPALYPEGQPTDDWKRPALDAYASEVKGLDTTGLPNKGAVLAAIGSVPDVGEGDDD